MSGQNALANAKRLFKALAAREANFDEPIPDDRITDVAAQIGLEVPLSRAGSRTPK